MKFGEKITIFLGALVLTLLGFSLIATQAVDVLYIGKQSGYEIVVKPSAAPGSTVRPLHHLLSRAGLEDLLPLAVIVLVIALIVLGKNEFSGKGPSHRSYQAPNP